MVAWVIGVLPWTLGMIGFFKRGVLFKTEGCLVVNGKGGALVFEEGWGEFFGTSAESMAVLGGWCLGGGERGERSGERLARSVWRVNNDELAVQTRLFSV